MRGRRDQRVALRRDEGGWNRWSREATAPASNSWRNSQRTGSQGYWPAATFLSEFERGHQDQAVRAGGAAARLDGDSAADAEADRDDPLRPNPADGEIVDERRVRDQRPGARAAVHGR